VKPLLLPHKPARRYRERIDRDSRRRQRELETADLQRRVRQQELFQRNVEVAAQVSARKAVALRVGREKMNRAASIFAAIDIQLNPLGDETN
jgi:hypothetical protein